MTEELKHVHDISKKDRPFLIILMFIPCIFVMFENLDSDIWFLLNHGRYVLENGIPHIEPFTIHQGFEFVMQQWLSASIFWIIYSTFGAVGLKFLVMLCYGLIVLVIYKLCMKISGDYFFVSYSVSLVISAMLIMFMTTRPYIFSILIFVLELYFLESFILSNNKKYLYLLPVLSVLLINLHAAMWPMLFVIIVPYFIDSFKFRIGPLSGQGYEKKSLLLAIGTMILVGFLNPYGIEAMTYLFRSYGYEEINMIVDEMKPPFINTGFGMKVYGSMLIVVLLYCVYRKGTTKLRYTLLTLGTAYMAISSSKSLLFFVICGLFPLTYYLKGFVPPVKQNNVKKTMFLRKILIGIIMLLILVSVYKFQESSVIINHEYKLLNDTIHFVLEQKDAKKVKLYTGYNDGGIAEFQGIPSYIDARAEVFLKSNNKKEDIMKEYIQMQAGSIYYKDVLDKYKFTHLIVTENDILYTYLKHDKDYEISYSNEKYTLFEPINGE